MGTEVRERHGGVEMDPFAAYATLTRSAGARAHYDHRGAAGDT